MNSDDFLQAARESLSTVVDGIHFEVATLIKNKDIQGSYANDFISHVAMTSQSTTFDIGEQFRTAWPRDFRISEWKKRVSEARKFVKESDYARKTSWVDFLISSENGPKPILANVISALRTAPEWRGVLAYDEFSMQTVVQGEYPGGGGRTEGPWGDSDDVSTSDWMQHQGILVKPDTVAAAVELVAKDNTFHPVRDYLASLVWDGKPRIGSWLTDYLGVAPREIPDHDTDLLLPPDGELEAIAREKYISYVGACWLIGAVARIFQPGAKMDTSLILEGPQGVRKSTALKILGGEWFTDELGEFGAKDTAMQTRGVWIIEIGELDAMSRSEVSQVKAFLSRTTDRFRPPYGRRIIESKRQCVFAGTVNPESYLKDETGARRFWPVSCGEIKTELLAADRDQLWAEAAKCYHDGQPWWFSDTSLTRAAQEEQGKRYIGDPWDCLIEDWVKSNINVSKYPGSVSVSEIMEGCLKIDKGRWSAADFTRVARSLKAHGMVRFQARDGKTREWRYRTT